MAQELAREIVSQSRSIGDVKSSLAFMFDPPQGDGKCVTISTVIIRKTPTDRGTREYLVTIGGCGVRRTALKYKYWDDAYKLIEACTGNDASTTAFRGTDATTPFKLIVTYDNGDAEELAQFENGNRPFKVFLKEKLALLDSETV